LTPSIARCALTVLAFAALAGGVVHGGIHVHGGHAAGAFDRVCTPCLNPASFPTIDAVPVTVEPTGAGESVRVRLDAPEGEWGRSPGAKAGKACGASRTFCAKRAGAQELHTSRAREGRSRPGGSACVTV